MQYTKLQVIEEQREEIERIPHAEEQLRKTLQALPEGKSPGLDGDDL